MKFTFTSNDPSAVADAEIQKLLTDAYVGGGYTTAEEARTLFDPVSVKARGVLIAAHETSSNQLAGIIILVPAGSVACKMAVDNEAEVHLLGVDEKFRNQGLGRSLIDEVINLARQSGYKKLILWTQSTMTLAQKLYEAAGFSKINEMQRNDRIFLVYELPLKS